VRTGAGIRVLVSATETITWCKWNELQKKIFRVAYVRVVWGGCWAQTPAMEEKAEE